MSIFRVTADTAKLEAQIAALTKQLATYTTNTLAAALPRASIDGRTDAWVLKRSYVYTGLGMSVYGQHYGWSYVKEDGALSSVAGEAKHFDTEQAALAFITTLAGQSFTHGEDTRDAGAWRAGHIVAKWAEG